MDLNTDIPWQRGDLFLLFILFLLSTGLVLLASKLVLKRAIDTSDAFYSSGAAVLVGIAADILLRMAFGQGTMAYWLVSAAAYLVIWVLALMIIVGLDLVESIAISIGVTILRVVLMALFFAYPVKIFATDMPVY